MSDSEDEFASAGEEVTDEEVESAEGRKGEKNDDATKEHQEAAKTTPDEKSDKDLVQNETKESVPKNDAEVIQRQPPTGYAHPEEAKDPRSALENLAAKESASGGGGWDFGGWGSSLWGTARSSVSAFTTQLGEGIHTVVESVESALDVPPPEEMAETKATGDKAIPEESKAEEIGEEKKEEEKKALVEEEKEGTQASDGSWWGVTSSVMSTAQKTTRGLMTGGLDVLETIGKKTMEALHETDPGLARTRELFAVGRRPRGAAGATLSQALREARERHEEAAQLEKRWEAERLGHFGAQFEDCQGLAHLEALELLASRAEAKLHSRLGQLTGEDLATARQELVRLKTVFERVEEDEDDEEEREEEEEVRSCEDIFAEVEQALGSLQVPAKEEVRRTLEVKEELVSAALAKELEKEANAEVEEEEGAGDDDDAKKAKTEEIILQALLQAGVQVLAHATAAWVGLFHKVGELALADALRWTEEGDEETSNLLSVTERLVSCALLASREIGGLGEEVAALLRKHSSKSTRRLSTQFVSAIYLETGNSKSYVRDALVLLLPVVQLASLK